MSTAVYHEMAMRLDHDILAKERELEDLRNARAGLQPLLDSASAASAAPVLALPAPGGARAHRGHVIDAHVIDTPASVSAPADAPQKAPRKSAKAKKAKPVSTRKAASGALPATGRVFWLKVMGKRKHTVRDILDKALLKLEAGEDQREVLGNRLNAWLYSSVKAGQLQDAGKRGNLKMYQVAAA